MIDRKLLWILISILVVMTVATLWRLSLLPDWRHVPLGIPGDHRSVNGFILFVGPGTLALAIANPFIRKFMTSGPEQSLQSWRRWSGARLVAVAIIFAAMQSFVLARSFGVFSAAGSQVIAQVFMVVTGLLIAAVGNALPKLPWLSARIRPLRLDPFQWNRQLRFNGRLLVGFGLVVAIVCPWLPQKTLLPVMLTMWLAAMAAGIWHRVKVKRAPSPLHPS